MTRLSSALSVALVVGMSSLPWAMAEPVVDSPEAAGMEIELRDEHLANLVPYLDWNYIQGSPEGKMMTHIWRLSFPEYAANQLSELPPEILGTLLRKAGLPASIRVWRSDLPPEILELLQRLRWFEDRNLYEFVHREPTATPEQALSDARQFARLARVESELFSDGRFYKPLDGSVTLHLHYSRRGVHAQLPANLLNLIFLARAHRELGEQVISEKFAFLPIERKGLLRLFPFEDNRIEIRYWPGRNPERTLQLLRRGWDNPNVFVDEFARLMRGRTRERAFIAQMIRGSQTFDALFESFMALDRVRPGWLMSQRWFREAVFEGLDSALASSHVNAVRLALSLQGTPAQYRALALEAFLSLPRVRSSQLEAFIRCHAPETWHVVSSLFPPHTLAINLGHQVSQEQRDWLRNHELMALDDSSKSQFLGVWTKRAETPEDLEPLILRFMELLSHPPPTQYAELRSHQALRERLTHILLEDTPVLSSQQRQRIQAAVSQSCPSLNRTMLQFPRNS
jgi:hypothetical protein